MDDDRVNDDNIVGREYKVTIQNVFDTFQSVAPNFILIDQDGIRKFIKDNSDFNDTAVELLVKMCIRRYVREIVED